ncbi:hypothetical protein [Streptomyces sp. NPDC052811]|uniref:hypothetical protein n=1 Tax=Streptomyces sp. NPDC052811 TaxID=3155731 RepID=UPI00342FDE25
MGLKARIAAAIDNNPAPGVGTVLDRLEFWLQLPKDTTFPKMLDADCDPRSQRMGTALSAPAARYDSPSLSAAQDITATWAGISNMLHNNRAVTVKGPTDHVGGELSLFRQDNSAGFHVILFLGDPGRTPGRTGGHLHRRRCRWERAGCGPKGVGDPANDR